MEQFRKRDDFTVAYIVPTKALISERKRDFNLMLIDEGLEGIPVASTSWEVLIASENRQRKSVWILTQERLQSIESRLQESMKLDLIVVDEAQRIEEGARGIVLEHSVSRAIRCNPDVQVIFLSPFTENPEKLAQVFNHPAVPLKTKYSPVDQNIFIVKTDEQGFDMCCVSKELGKEIHMPRMEGSGVAPPAASYQKKVWAVNTFADKSPTIVYCDDASKCLKTAEALAETRDEQTLTEEISEVVRFLSRNIHKDYYLNEFLGKRIAFHYGNMPSMVRVAVESLFRRKMIDVICCTTTLLEGINLPAKNMILHRPKVGGTAMKEISFLNLTGRAGRFAKDFSGDIYCIDVDGWDKAGYKPTPAEGRHSIESSMESVIRDNKEDVISHLKTYMKSSHDNGDLDAVRAAVTRFIISALRKENKDLLAQLKLRESRITDEYLKEIEMFVEDIVKKIRAMPGDVVLRNETIDPRLQHDLFEKLMNCRDPPTPKHHPNDNEFYSDLVQILSLTNDCFKRGLSEPQIKRIAVLATKWIREEGLGEIINEQIRRDPKCKDGKISKSDVNKIIRDTIETISKDIEFKIYRDVSCYMDILAYVLMKRGIQTGYISTLPYYIELGASKLSTITLVNMGVPRTIDNPHFQENWR